MSTTITMEQLNEILAAVQAGNGRGRKRKGSGFKRSKPTSEETELRRKANDEECYRKFTAAGYKDVKPRINVLTFGKWAEKGRQVRRGEKGTQVGPFSLFHESQTDPITATPAASVGTVRDPKAVAEFMTPPTTPAPAVTATAPRAEVKAVDPVAKAIEAAAKMAETKSDWTEWNS